MVTQSKPIGQSNVDLTGRRIVKRGDTVSWYGLRFHVERVRLGLCFPRGYLDAGGGCLTRSVPCKSVQVVA